MNDQERAGWLAKTTVPTLYYPLRLFRDIFTILSGWLNLPTNIWLNHSLGSRYLTLDRVIFALFSMSFFSTLSWMIMGSMNYFGFRSGVVGGESFGLFSLAFLLMAAWQTWRNHRRPWYQHSRSFGNSRLLPLMHRMAAWLPLDLSKDAWLENRLNWLAYRVVHPALVFGVGWLVRETFDPAFGLYLQISSGAIFIEAHLAFKDRKDRYYDFLDALLDSHALKLMIEGKPTPQKLGVHAIEMTSNMDIEPLDIEETVLATIGNNTQESVAASKLEVTHDHPDSE